MLILQEVLRAWGTPQFESVLQRQLAQQAVELPLQQGMTQGSSITDGPITVMLLHTEESGTALHLRLGIVFQSVLGGCSCAGDPTPLSESTEYCELELDVDKATAFAQARLAAS
jgi:hypothetical protein